MKRGLCSDHTSPAAGRADQGRMAAQKEGVFRQTGGLLQGPLDPAQAAAQHKQGIARIPILKRPPTGADPRAHRGT